jgi:hypothetical protein
MSTQKTLAPLLSQITVEHGPAELLGRFFLRAEEEVRQRGIILSFGSFEELVAVNVANRETWLPLIPTFDPQYCTLGPKNGFCILGRNTSGEVVLTQACRVWDLSETSLHDLFTNLYLYYDNPVQSKGLLECCTVTVEAAKHITGRVAFAGGVWYRRDFRGLETQMFMARMARALAYTRWNTNYSTGAISENVMRTRMARMAGHTHLEWEVKHENSPMLGSSRYALVWMNAEETLRELSQFMSSLDSQIDAAVERRRAKKQFRAVR